MLMVIGITSVSKYLKSVEGLRTYVTQTDYVYGTYYIYNEMKILIKKLSSNKQWFIAVFHEWFIWH